MIWRSKFGLISKIMDIIKKNNITRNPNFSGYGIIAEEAFLTVTIAHKDALSRLICELG